MATKPTYKEINVATATFPVSIGLSSKTQQYKIYGTKALSANVAVNASGTPSEGMEVHIDWCPTVTTTTTVDRFGDYSFTIFGTKVPYSWLAKKLNIICKYHNSAWGVWAVPSVDTLPHIALEALNLTDILNSTQLEANGTTGKMQIKAGGISGTELAAGAVSAADKIADAIITLAKLVGVTRGSILVGNSSGRPAELAAKTSGQVLVGDGNDVVSVPISGDITLSAAGVAAIGAAKILAAMINSGEITNTHINAAAAIAFTKMAALTASKIPVLNSSGFVEASAYATSILSYLNVSTPGTREANKALVVGATGAIDALNILALTLNGTLITATPAEINYLSGVTSSIQDQIDEAFSKETHTTLTADTTATAATLKQNYILSTAGGAVNLTMPDASTVESGFPVTVIQKGANAGTMVAHAGQNVENKLGSDVASLACSGNGGGFKVVCNGTDTWQVVMTF